MAYCNKCGHNLPDGSAFCPKCGNRVSITEILQIDNSDDKKERSLNLSTSEETSDIFNTNNSENNQKKDAAKLWKRILGFICCFCLIVAAAWLIQSATHYSSPIPQLNAMYAKYISDLHNLKMGMEYEEVAQILDHQLKEVYASNDYVIYEYYGETKIEQLTAEKVLIDFQKGALRNIAIYFNPRDPLAAEKTLTEHYSKIFGKQFKEDIISGSYYGENFYLHVSILPGGQVCVSFDA